MRQARPIGRARVVAAPNSSAPAMVAGSAAGTRWGSVLVWPNWTSSIAAAAAVVVVTGVVSQSSQVVAGGNAWGSERDSGACSASPS